jgi:hypothetical protein
MSRLLVAWKPNYHYNRHNNMVTLSSFPKEKETAAHGVDKGQSCTQRHSSFMSAFARSGIACETIALYVCGYGSRGQWLDPLQGLSFTEQHWHAVHTDDHLAITVYEWLKTRAIRKERSIVRNVSRENYACNRPCRPMGVWNVEVHTFPRKSVETASRLSAVLCLPGTFLLLIYVWGWVNPRAILRLEGLGKLSSLGIESATF